MGEPASGSLAGRRVAAHDRPRGSRPLRLAVYTDAVYLQVDDQTYAQETFSLFAARLRPEVARLVLLGRTRPGRGTPATRTANLLPAGVELLALPDYPELAASWSLLRPLAGSLRAFWRCLEDVDAVWLLGPHPMAVLFAVMARARGRDVVLGVRQDLPAYVRGRHPGSRWAATYAALLEGGWRFLARRTPVAVVGTDLARQYAGSRELTVIAVSLIEEEDVCTGDPEPALSDGTRTLLSVGRLDPEKNPLLLADVLRLLHAQDPSWRLVVCGDGPLRETLSARLEHYGLAHAAQLRGQLPLDGLDELYRSSHALLHVSWTEGVPQVLLEAFARGLPVVATAVGGVPGLASGAALLVPPGDASAAAAAVRRLDDPVLRARLSEAARRTARAHTGRAERERLLALIPHRPVCEQC